MKRSALFLSLAVTSLPLLSSRAAIDLKQSKFTQVVNDVQVISADQNATPAQVDGIFKVPDILRTGPNSRAELTADDQTITRVGANTVFSFDPANRTIDLQKGSVLFHSPKGRGGGTVQTGSATASVLGTTIVVSTTPDGGFKVLVLEGVAEVKFLNGLSQQLNAGQMTFVLPGGGTSPVIVFRLDEQTKGSKLVNGFDHALDSMGKINDEIDKQLKLINKDKLKDTGLLVGDHGSGTGVETVDPSVLQSYFQSLTQFQPFFTGIGYFTIDGFFITPDNEENPPTDAFFPAFALSVNVTIASATLDNRHIFISEAFDVLPPEPLPPGFLKNPFMGFFGRNIHITTPHIDMTPYAELSFFDFLAAQNMTIDGDLTFDNASGQFIFLTAGGQIIIADGSTITGNSGYLYLGSLGPMLFNNVTINNAGAVDLASHLDLSLTGGSINAGGFAHFLSEGHGMNISGETISAGTDVNMLSQSTGVGATPALAISDSTITGQTGVIITGLGDVNVTGSTINAPDGDVSFTSSASALNLTDATITAGNLNPVPQGLNQADPHSIIMHAGTSANLNGGSYSADTITVIAVGDVTANNVTMAGNHLTMTAGGIFNNTTLGDANLSTMDLSSFADVNISGHTVVLTSVNFNNVVNITSDSGNVAAGINTDAAIVRGDINMVHGVTFNGTTLSDANRNTYINPESGNGIYTHARNP